MDFELPKEITDKLAELDAFIEAEIKPLERDNIQFFDHRRENARTDWDDDGRPRNEWRALISEMDCETYPSPNFGKTLQRGIFDSNQFYRLDEDDEDAGRHDPQPRHARRRTAHHAPAPTIATAAAMNGQTGTPSSAGPVAPTGGPGVPDPAVVSRNDHEPDTT